MTWPIVGISLFAANISSSTLVGLAGDAFKTDAHVYNYEWFAVIVLIFFSIFFLPFYLRSKVYTMPEFLERRYDSRSRYYFSFITIVGNVLIDTAAGLYVGNIVLKLIFPDLSPSLIIIILAFAAAAYTIPGGLNSVIQTEVIQAILLIIGSCILTYLAFQQVGGWDDMIAGLNAKHAAGELALNADQILSMERPEDDEFMPLSGLLIGVPILGFYFWANNQFMVQRVLGAKDLNHGRWGALFAGLLKLPVIFIMVIPGILAILMYDNLDLTALGYIGGNGEVCANLKDCPNMTYPVLLFDLLPVGLLGLVLAGLLAAMMSSVSATFNSASTLITMDFVKKMNPDISDKRLVRSGQIATLVLVVLASLWAPQIEKFGSLFKYLQLVLSYICPPVVAVFILGLFWRRMNSAGSITALLSGFAMAIFMLLNQGYEWIPALNEIHFLHMTGILTAICAMIHIGVSLSTPIDPDDSIEDYIYKKELFDEDTESLKGLPWYKNFRILAIILLIITVLLVGSFW
jgi:SSS family solute:Na+ symporter